MVEGNTGETPSTPGRPSTTHAGKHGVRLGCRGVTGNPKQWGLCRAGAQAVWTAPPRAVAVSASRRCVRVPVCDARGALVCGVSIGVFLGRGQASHRARSALIMPRGATGGKHPGGRRAPPPHRGIKFAPSSSCVVRAWRARPRRLWLRAYALWKGLAMVADQSCVASPAGGHTLPRPPVARGVCAGRCRPE